MFGRKSMLALAALALKRPWRDAFCWVTLIAAVALFVYFLPVLVSGIGVGPTAFEARVWLPTWR